MKRLTKEEYIEAIHVLQRPGGKAKTGDIARHMGVRPPSVTQMLGKLQEEGLVGNRLNREAVAVSLMKVTDEAKALVGKIPAFLVGAEEIDELTSVQKARYLTRLTQLQLLAAVELKDELKEAASHDDRQAVLGSFLNKVGINFQNAGGFMRPTATSLLSEALSEYLAAYEATAKAA